ncbi:MAG TPA: hypothetical protein VH500_10595 [Nitrososphaeraceae archaeon]
MLFETSDSEGLLDIVEHFKKSPLVEYAEPHMVGQGVVPNLSSVPSVSFIDGLPADKMPYMTYALDSRLTIS